jgi:hypothetical protein
VSLQKKVMKKVLELMADPRVGKLMADPRVMKAVMAAMSVPGKVSSFTAESVEKIAKAMDLPSSGEMDDLKRQVRRLEGELDSLRKERDAEKKKR